MNHKDSKDKSSPPSYLLDENDTSIAHGKLVARGGLHITQHL